MFKTFKPSDERLSNIEQLLLIILEQTRPAEKLSFPQSEPPIKIERVCELLSISKSTARNWMKDGRIPFKRIGSRIYFFESEILESLEQPLKWRRAA
ncbi:helix-turn-helix domain-containing protein [Adhaeribacter radiodurans]|uniref:Helix-turn-helix domain-containing protein n=1 Tax=Adhaeribacter radiodurans TaxID=2745197 RepID=A0A7L7L7P5_9BACT|nr:helix-turn-helix domain-containing protein [Adhaeribacter radiodurans]